MPTPAPATFANLLESAVNEPGTIADAYRAFHSYSLGYQLLAFSQCMTRGLPLGPLATFPRWKALGRHVKKGEKAITLCQPVTCKRTKQTDDGTDESAVFTRFTYRGSWFVLAQTEGQEIPPVPIPEWDRTRALETLGISEVSFAALDGNVMGFARAKTIAISPLNPMPHKTTFHEVAHILLGHTSEAEQKDGELTPRNLRECEAEAVAPTIRGTIPMQSHEHAE